MSNQTFWIIRRTQNVKFPYRLIISSGNKILLDLFVQEKWPGTKGNIFCLWAPGREEIAGEEEEIERVPVVSYRAFGKRITVILGRAIQKRCSFLFITKAYKTKEGSYDQIFWQTQQGLTQRKTKYKLSYNRPEKLTIFADTGERYAWNFPSASIIKEKLPIGDYAIKDQLGFLAIVERKTFQNLMQELGNLKKFHQHLNELDNCKNSALVVEAAYSDFLDPKKIQPYVGLFAAKAIAEIQTLHPNLPIIFSDSRKSAIIWTLIFFETVASKAKEISSDYVRDSGANYQVSKNTGFSEDEIRRAFFSNMPDRFDVRQMTNVLPGFEVRDIKRVLAKMENEGLILRTKEKNRIVWEKRRVI